MNRLQRELHRLYGQQVAAVEGPLGLGLDAGHPIDTPGRVRAMVLELARPANWALLSAVWQGVQTDLDLPAPAIAVNGSDGCQLWFSLQQPEPMARALAFLAALQRRYLGDMAPARVGLLAVLDAVVLDAAVLDAVVPPPPGYARPVPAAQPESGFWSAYVASELAALFADEPWLDVPPSLDGQAQLLAPLKPITPLEFEAALRRLGPAVAPATAGEGEPAAAQALSALEPRRFLFEVLNNPSVDLALRVQAAIALLPDGV